MVGRSISGTQKDVDTKSDSDRCVAMAADGLQLSTFRVSKDEPGRRWERHTISMRPPITLVKTFQIPETRGGTTYKLNTENIGRNRQRKRPKSREDLRSELDLMKCRGSPAAQRLLNIIANWALGPSTASDCLNAIERVLDSTRHSPRSEEHTSEL